MYSYLSYFGYKHAQRVMQGFWDVVDRQGLDRNPYRTGFLQLVAISDTDAKAEAEYTAHADYFYNRCLHVFEGFADAPGYRTQATYIIGGSPATVRDRLKQVTTDMHVGHLMVLCHFGSMPKELTLQNTELFAKHVLPELQTMWGDWDNKWRPQSIPLKTQPAPTSTH
jgi:alkanesulfonate monooxygenase SsuD/methylene tetrahydromethanopterin reductase-like flavin-dependent oxidoreductase (luciferase family)